MRRKVPTGRLAPVADERLRLIVDYEDAQDFLEDYAQNLAQLRGVVQTERAVAAGTIVQLGLTFPGLREPIIVEGVVRDVASPDAAWTHVELVPSVRDSLRSLVDRIRADDRRVVAPVVRVLIAEDNAYVCELVRTGVTTAARRELRDTVFAFETAHDGGGARELLATRRFDAAIIDVYLPVLDGEDLIRQIRGDLGLATLPVIALSGGGETARALALRAGATAYLDKPIRLRMVVDALRELIAVGHE